MTTRRNPATATPAVKRPGRPPAAGTRRQVRISATVPPEYRDWLQEHGDIAAQIRVGIEWMMLVCDSNPELIRAVADDIEHLVRGSGVIPDTLRATAAALRNAARLREM